MKTANHEILSSSINKRTLDTILKEREKRLGKLQSEKSGRTVNADSTAVKESKGKTVIKGILKAVYVAAGIALIAALAYVCYLPIYMQEHGLFPAAGSETAANAAGETSVDSDEPYPERVSETAANAAGETSVDSDEPYPERVEDWLKSWTDPGRTDKISMEDAAKIKKYMTLEEVVKLIGKPVGSVTDLMLGLIMEWEIDNGAALHVSIGSTASYVQNLGSLGNFRVISCEIKRGPAAIYTPDYNSTSTLHADVFLEKLKNEGYHKNDGMDTNYNVDNIKAVYNITPAAILSEEPDLELFYVKDGDHCFMMYKGKIYRFETFGGYHHRLVLWDYDGNGVKDLFAYDSWGSGMLFLGVDVFDLTTMKCHTVIPRNVLLEPGFSFDFDGENVYIDGTILTYSDGEFHCGDIF